jgi:Ion transport protein
MQGAIEEYRRSEGYVPDEVVLPSNATMRYFWQLFEYPEMSRAGFVVALLSVSVTLVSIILFCVETLPIFATTHCVEGDAPNFLDSFFLIETACTAWFTIEAIVRFLACPEKLRFLFDFKNVVDVMAIVPYYVTLFNVLSTMSCSSAKSSASLAFLRVIRLVRIFKLTKHSVGLQVR